MARTSATPPQWPARLLEAAEALRAAPPAVREAARAALWPVLHAALFAALRAQAGRLSAATTEDLEDLASQKALELLARAEEGLWSVAGRREHEIAGYVARVARHALVDLARRRGRESPAPEDPEAWATAVASRGGEPLPPEEHLAALEFARSLRCCVGALTPRARYAWFRRVYLERPSREIAEALGVSPAHVDVIVQRARAALRRCMDEKGHAGEPPRPGAFATLWDALGAEEPPAGGGEPE